MKIPDTLITILRTMAWTALAIGLLIGWRALPYLPSNHPPQAVGLPAGWTPAGPDLALQWSDPILVEGRGLQRTGSNPWLMFEGHPLFLATSLVPRRQPDQFVEKLDDIQVKNVDGMRMLRFPQDADPQIAIELRGEIWVIANPKRVKGSPFLAVRVDPLTGKILEGESIAPKPVDRKGTLWEKQYLSFQPVPDLGGVVIYSTNRSLATPAVLWRPGEPVAPITLQPLLQASRNASFRRSDGQWLISTEDQLQAMASAPGQLSLTSLGQRVAPVLPVLSVPRGWDVPVGSRDPQLIEPPLRLRQSYIIREYQYENWTEKIPLTLQSPQDLAQLGTAFDSGLQKYFQDRELAKYQNTTILPVYVAQPLTLDSPAGSTLLAGDTGAAEVEAAAHGRREPLMLFRLNPAEALVVQWLPFEEAGQLKPTMILRFGFLTVAGTQIQWLSWARLPAIPPEAFLIQPRLDIYADGPQWTLGLHTYISSNKGYQAVATSATMPCPPGITVDGTGWLIASH